MKWILFATVCIAGLATAFLTAYQKSEAEVSFSEIEKTYQNFNLEELQDSLKDVRSKIQKNDNWSATEKLNKEKVVLTKLIIFRKHGQL